MRRAFPYTLAVIALAAVAACSTDAPMAPTIEPALAVDGGPSIAAATVRVRCEARGTSRSKISVDVSNLTPLNGMWSSRVTSGANSASAPAARAVGDEVEFDYDSDPANIRAGATPISRTFIAVNASGPDVRADVLSASGAVVATGSADCRVR